MSKNFDLDNAIRKIPDFPKPGILFYDIASLLSNPEAFDYCIETMIKKYKNENLDGIAAIESRGFLFASPLAKALKLPIIMIRKKGKLPGETISCSYDLEYGSEEIEIQTIDIKPNSNILVVDDLIATGGTLGAARTLIEKAGANVTEFFGIIGLPFLNYEETLKPTKITTLIEYFSE